MLSAIFRMQIRWEKYEFRRFFLVVFAFSMLARNIYAGMYASDSGVQREVKLHGAIYTLGGLDGLSMLVYQRVYELHYIIVYIFQFALYCSLVIRKGWNRFVHPKFYFLAHDFQSFQQYTFAAILCVENSSNQKVQKEQTNFKSCSNASLARVIR